MCSLGIARNLVDCGSEAVLDYCEKHNIGFIPRYPLAEHHIIGWRIRRTGCGRQSAGGLSPSSDSLLKSRSRRDGGLPRKDLLQQYPMHFLVAIRAAIAGDQQSVVRVGGMPQGREYDAAEQRLRTGGIIVDDQRLEIP